METIRELFQHELRDIYYAEHKLLDALGELVQESTTPEIRTAFADHREQTRGHVDRLDSVFRMMGASPATAPCPGIEGLVKEKMLFAQQQPSPRLLDLYNLGASVKSERYEISAYEGLINMARNLGMVEVPISAFRQSLDGTFSIDLTADEIDNLPEFQEANYTTPPADYALPVGVTPGSLYWPAGMIMGPPPNIPLTGPDVATGPDSAVEAEVRSALSQQAWENAVVGKGSTVTASDGKNIGKVEDLAFDPKTGELTELVVRSGLLAHKDRQIDPSMIASVDDGVIYLKVNEDQLPTS